MTLLELLVQQLPKSSGWTEVVKFFAQDGNGNIWSYPRTPKYYPNTRIWGCHGGDSKRLLTGKPLSSDFSSAIITREQYEAAIKPSEWNGEGLPPVGEVIEYSCIFFNPNRPAIEEGQWYKGTVIAYYDDCVWTSDNGIRPLDNTQFRPIRSEADYKREDATASMLKPCTNYNKTDVIHTVGEIYDAIIAHKIPGVTTIPNVGQIMRATESCSREDAQKIVDLLNGD